MQNLQNPVKDFGISMDYKFKACINPDEFPSVFSQMHAFTTQCSPAKIQGYFKGSHLHSSTGI